MAIGVKKSIKSLTVSGLKKQGAIAAIASAPVSAAWRANSIASTCELLPTWTITLNRPLDDLTHCSRIFFRSLVVRDCDSPVVPHTNTPVISDLAIRSAYLSITERLIFPWASIGVKDAAISPFKR